MHAQIPKPNFVANGMFQWVGKSSLLHEVRLKYKRFSPILALVESPTSQRQNTTVTQLNLDS